MKIRIDFSTTEKIAIMNACDIHDDNTVKSEGNFGKGEYNAEENFIELDLKENFIIATANLIGTCVNMLKSLFNTCKIYESSWLKDIKTESNKKESEDCYDKDENKSKKDLYEYNKECNEKLKDIL